jgi:hypothetical protein
MGYNTRVTGAFTATPPITWTEMKDTPYASDDRRASDLKLHVVENTVDTPWGDLIERTATKLSLRDIDEYRAYNLIEHVQAAIDAFPDHEFTGHLHCEGDENDDIWRVAIRDGRAIEVKPRIVWDDEPTEAQPVPDRLAVILKQVALTKYRALLDEERGWLTDELQKVFAELNNLRVAKEEQ